MIYVFLALIIFIFIYVFSVYNSLVKLRNIVKEAFSTMDIYLKKRWDLVPNLVEVVKGYAKHEQQIFKKVTSLRASTYENMTKDNKINVNEQLTAGISNIMAVAENYPELKANENFVMLSQDLVKIEDEIANSRKYYNGAVRIFNDRIQMFPSNIIANIFGFKSENMFEANAEEKNNIKVEL